MNRDRAGLHHTGAFLDPFAPAATDGVVFDATQTIDVAPGQTYVITGTLSSYTLLIAEGGTTSHPVSGQTGVKGGQSATNDGTIELLGGVTTGSGNRSHLGGLLQVEGTLTNNGLITVAGGPGGYKQAPGGVINVIGVLTNNGTIDLAGAQAANGYMGTGGILELNFGNGLFNNGLIDVAGATGAPGGRLRFSGLSSNTGTIVLEGGTLMHNLPLSGETGPSAVFDFGTGTMTNSGTLMMDGGSGTGGPGLGLGSYVFQNHVVTMTNTGLIKMGGGYAGAAATYGLITGAHFIQYGIIFNDGSIELDAGVTETGSHAVAGGAVFVNSHNLLQNDGMMTVEGTSGAAGVVPSLNSAAKLGDNGVIVNNGLISLLGGNSQSTTAPGMGGELSIYGPQYTYGAGHLSNYGTIVAAGGYKQTSTAKSGNGGTITVVGGTLSNFGFIDLQAGQASPVAKQDGNGAQLTINSGYATNAGTITAEGLSGPTVFAGQIIDRAQFSNTGLVMLGGPGPTSTGDGTMTVISTGVLTDGGTITGPGTLTNQGTIRSGPSSGGVISTGLFANSGTVSVAAGVGFTLDSSVNTAAGTQGMFSLQKGATLTFAASVASNQEVSFVGNGSILDLGDASAFAGVLAGLAPSNVIDFLGLNVTSAVATGTTLAIGLGTGGTIDLTLAAPLATNTGLQLVSDMNGGTDLDFIKVSTGH